MTRILGSIALGLLWIVGYGVVHARLDDLRLKDQPYPDAQRTSWWALELGDARRYPPAARPWLVAYWLLPVVLLSLLVLLARSL